ncbi:MAG TPA: class I SAM-dependent methyltransferase [Rubrobacteraceae bacterium]|nr:class I SAM-dependent methyltransferase [Rubrobacteraceae bacterium]
MSSYENYTQTSKNYDKTREPVGTEITVGCFAHAPAPLDRAVVLDAGCGTGNYARAMLNYVDRIEAVDLNPGMLEVAEGKLAQPLVEGRISFHSARIDALPFEDAAFDGLMINQVLHHLPDDPAKGFPVHRQVFEEFARVLKPDGVLVVNTCSQEQLRHGYWHYSLIREAADALRNRYAPLDELVEILDDCDFEYRGRFAPIDATVQGRAYFDPRGPLAEEWRNGDSAWALVTEDQLERALHRVQKLDEQDELEAYVARNDARRQDIGQVTILFASRR